jgi:autotransporter-associated beta strand protein
LASAVLGGAGRFYLTNSTLTLSDNFNSLTGGIGLTGGTLTLTNASNLGSGSFLLGSAGTLGTLQVNTTTRATNGFVVSDSSTNTSINVASGQSFTMSGTISQTNGNNNATKFGKDGAGTLVMAGSNGTYGGQLQIGNGSVIVGVNNALGTNVTTSARGVDLGLNVGDTAQANNVSLLISNGVTFGQSIYVATNSSSATRTIGLSGTGDSGSFTNEIYQDGDLTLDAGSSTGTLTVSGAIVTNNAAVAKGIIVTNGTTVLSGNNSYSGLTTVGVGGTLKLGSANALGAANANAEHTRKEAIMSAARRSIIKNF